MKWKIAVVLIFSVLIFSGCGKKKDESEVASSTPSESQTASSSASDIGAESTISTAPAPVPVMIEGTFTDQNLDKYTAERAPRLIVNKDGTAKFVINTGEVGDANFTGTYELLGKTLTFTVKERVGNDFLGKDISILSFEMLDEDHFMYRGQPLGLSRDGDQFTRDGKTPLDTAQGVGDNVQNAGSNSVSELSNAIAGAEPAQPAPSSNK